MGIVVAIAAAVFCGKAAFVARSDLKRLAVTPYVLDDSFIFMHVARNLGTAGQYSYDGERPTCGAPILWTCLTSLNHLFLDKTGAAKATLVETCAFASMAAVLVFLIGHRVFGRRAAWLSCFLALFSGPLFFQAMNGMDTYPFAFLVLAAVYLRLCMRDRWGNWIALGALLGLANLMRPDGIILSACVFLWELRSGVRQRPGKLALAALIAALLTLPVAGWHYHVSGTIFASNQRGRLLIAREYYGNPSQFIPYMLISLRHVLIFSRLYEVTLGSFVLSMAAMIWGLASRRTTGPLVPFLASAGVAYVLFCFYQWYFPDAHGLRYVVYPCLLLAVFLGGFLDFLAHVVERELRRKWAGTLAAVLLAAVLVTYSLDQYKSLVETDMKWTSWDTLLCQAPTETERRTWAAIDWIEATIPPGAALAAQHHGKIAYFTGTRIADTAGIIDAGFVDAVRQGDLNAFLETRRVGYVVPAGGRLDELMGLDSGLFERVPDAPVTMFRRLRKPSQ